ncbi:MAG: hypothetical protein HUU21_04700, partial [Polyangiaceae bacterium]|nr:hypothetical protein [Polyangiaceae bacterium]
MKGESPLWGVLMSATGASFLIVAVALVLVSKRAADEAALAAAVATGAPDNVSIPSASAEPAALVVPTTSPTESDAPQEAEMSADAGADA